MSFNVSPIASFLKSDRERFSMKLVVAILVSVIAIGCSADKGAAPTVPAESTEPVGSDSSETSAASGVQIPLSPENTLIQFVGTHVGADPDPKARTGKFTEFAGTAVVTDDELSSLSIEIQMSSVQTGNENLDGHLQNEDFFSVREYPTATFESQRIARNEDGQHLVTGNLTLHSATKEITFPATVGMVDGKLTLSGTMTLDRTAFGMTKMTDKVNANVEMTFKIGDGAAG